MSSTIFKRGDACGGYRVLELMGCGGIAEVYKALNLTSQEIVALKVLRQCHAQNGYVRDHMLAEAELLSKMSHVNVVRVEDVGMDSQLLWMAMEYLPGVTLRTLLKTSSPLAVPTALYYAREIADGVNAAHEMGVIHRDLKPENVIITEQHKVKVLDMGAAKFHGWNIKATMKGSIFGTPLYMSPEHIREEAIDARSDVYSLGLMLYEMIAGFHPFAQGKSGPLGKYEVCEMQLHVTPPPLAVVRDGLQEELSDLVRRCVAKDRDERPRSMMEFAQSVRSLLKSIVTEGRVASLHDIPFGSAPGEEGRGAGGDAAPRERDGGEPASISASLGEGASSGGQQGYQDDDDTEPTRVFTRLDTTAPLSMSGASRETPSTSEVGAHGTVVIKTSSQSPMSTSSPRLEQFARRPPATGVSLNGGGSFAPRWIRWFFMADGPPSDVLRRDCLVERALRTLLAAIIAITFLYWWIAKFDPAPRGEDLRPAVAGTLDDSNGER